MDIWSLLKVYFFSLRLAVSCFLSWKFIFNAAAIRGCSARGCTCSAWCPMLSRRPGRWWRCTSWAGACHSSHPPYTESCEESITTTGPQPLRDAFSCQHYPGFFLISPFFLLLSCWAYGYNNLEWIFDAPNVAFLVVCIVILPFYKRYSMISYSLQHK